MSGLPFELLLAVRYLRPKRTFVSVITLISVLGVTLGVAVLIIVISVMSGFDADLREKILGFNPHLRVTKVGETLHEQGELVRRISQLPEVKGAAPYVLGRVMVETQPKEGPAQVEAPILRGMDVKLDPQAGSLSNHIKEGRFDLGNRGVLVGNEFAVNLGLEVGDSLLIYSPEDLKKMRQSRNKEGEQGILPDEYDVRGIFDVGYYDYNYNFILTSLEDAQELYVLGDDVHGLFVTLKDPYRAPVVQQELERMLGPGFRISTWIEDNSNLLGAIVVEKNVMFYLLFFIMIVAALCILSALITFVVQKTREIGMLKALGATDIQVAGLFLSQSGFVGGVGVAAGYCLGRLLIAYRNEFLTLLRQWTHLEIFPKSIYGFDKLPALIVPRDLLIICGSALLVCLLGGAIPAWRAGRLKPVEALRYE